MGELILYKLRIFSSKDYGRCLARRIEKLGGIYVKIGQLLSVRPDIISFAVTKELNTLLQQLKSVHFSKIQKKLHECFGGEYNNVINETGAMPLGTGSIAQVHKIKLGNGTTAVVKIIKPGIDKHFRTDLKMFNFFMKMCSYMPIIRKLPVRELALEIDTLMRQQLDLRKEGENLEEFQRNFAGNADVIIPGWNKEISWPEFIILEYIDLPPQPDYKSWTDAQRTEVAQKALKMLYQMMFKDGFTHCDMHPGNFFITEEGKFILLDFGMVTKMSDEFRNDFIRFFFYMSTNNGKGCAEIIEKTALHKSKRFDREKLHKEVSLFIADFSALPAEEFSVIVFTKKLIQVERKCGIKGATAFINNILAIAFFESHLKQIDPGIDFQEEAAQYILKNVPSFADIVNEL